MPERSFGRTVRYRRNKLGLSQARLGELVGRSQNTVRSWERDKTRPTETQVLEALSAILGVDQRMLFEKAGQEFSRPDVEDQPTVEQEFATLSPASEGTEPEVIDVIRPADFESDQPGDEAGGSPETPLPQASDPAPAYRAPAVASRTTPISTSGQEPSYIEDGTQRQLYRLRYLATVVVLVALGIALLWAAGESLGALGDWWDQFFGDLRL